MKRGLAIIALSLSAAALHTDIVWAQAKVEGPKVAWQLSTWGNPRAFTRGVEHVAKEVEERTGGNFTIKVVHGSQLAPERENLDGIAIGAFEMAMTCLSYHPAKNPASMVMDLPFLPLASFDIAREVYETVYKHPFIVRELAKWNARLYMAAILPQYEFMGVGNPPNSLDDWKGKRVRALGGLGDAMRAIGANPTTVTPPEVYTSLDRGTIDAASFPYSYAHASYRLHEISKWYTTNMSPGTINCPTLINMDAWKKLPAQYQKLLEDAKLGAYGALKSAYAAADEKNLPLFKEKGMTAITYSDAELDKFRAAAGKPVWDKWVAEAEAKQIPGKELLQLILDTAKKAAKS